jgi:hypothetical protein
MSYFIDPVNNFGKTTRGGKRLHYVLRDKTA